MPDNYTIANGGVKYDAGKPRMDLLPPDALIAIAEVFTFGAEKYDAWNWAKGMRGGRLVASLHRHMAAYQLGQDHDEESGLHHLAHAGCCVMMLLGLHLRDTVEDDRCPTEKRTDDESS